MATDPGSPRPPHASASGVLAPGSLAAELSDLAAAMHRLARALEPAVVGEGSAYSSGVHAHLLAEAYSVAQAADLKLARLGQAIGGAGGTGGPALHGVPTGDSTRAQLAALHQIAQHVNSTLDLPVVLRAVIDALVAIVRAERGYLMLWDEQTHQLEFALARGADGQTLSEGDFSLSRGIVGQVWESRQALLTTDAQADDAWRQHMSVVVHGIRSVMCAPLRVRDRVLGVVYVDSRTECNLFERSHLDLLVTCCHQAAIAMENARLIADLRQRMAEIAAMKAYMDDVFASIASGVITADAAGIVTTFNRAAERMLLLSGQRAIGQPYQAVLEPLGDDEITAMVRRAIGEHQTTLGHEITQEMPPRGQVCLRLNIAPLRSGEGEGETLGVAMVLDDLTELRRSQRQAEEIQRLFGRYVHPAVVRRLLEDPSAVQLGGETREITVVFADVRDYTALAASRAPDEVMRLLNGYLNTLTEAIWHEEGTLTMFIGDALMAIFNAPLPQADHALRAVRAAWAMRRALRRRQAEHDVPLHYGIGVHTGLAVVGNIGASGRLQNYTAIGDAVNIAQRLQAGAADQVILSAATYAAIANDVRAQALAPLLVKGRTEPLQVYQLDDLALDETRRLRATQHEHRAATGHRG